MADAISKVLVLPEVRERMAAMGVTVEYMTPEQLGAREQAYTQTWARIIRASGFQAQ
jgi:tripartite-type tricarboxylate transporter receptor subunit TctC